MRSPTKCYVDNQFKHRWTSSDELLTLYFSLSEITSLPLIEYHCTPSGVRPSGGRDRPSDGKKRRKNERRDPGKTIVSQSQTLYPIAYAGKGSGQTRINVLSRLVLDFSRTGNGCGCVNIKNLSHREQNNMHTAALSRLSFYFGSK